MEPSTHLEDRYKETALDDNEKKLRVAFVNAYMKTRDPVRACIELGFLEAYARDWACQFMQEGFVLRLISRENEEQNKEEEAPARKARYRAWMEREANFMGKGSSHGARVTAISNLMKIEGMDAPIKVENEVTHRGGVMMVPVMQSPDDWGKGALDSQTNLKSSVKD